MIIEPNRVWVFGDNVDTDLLAPGKYMKGSIEEMATHCLEALEPSFATSVRDGDVIVGGDNFGMGSSREQAAEVLIHLGVRAVIARSFGRIFYRNSLNLGLPVLACADTERVRGGDEIRVDVVGGTVENLTRNEQYPCERIPPQLMEMIEAGGLIPHLEKKLKAAST